MFGWYIGVPLTPFCLVEVEPFWLVEGGTDDAGGDNDADNSDVDGIGSGGGFGDTGGGSDDGGRGSDDGGALIFVDVKAGYRVRGHVLIFSHSVRERS